VAYGEVSKAIVRQMKVKWLLGFDSNTNQPQKGFKNGTNLVHVPDRHVLAYRPPTVPLCLVWLS